MPAGVGGPAVPQGGRVAKRQEAAPCAFVGVSAHNYTRRLSLFLLCRLKFPNYSSNIEETDPAWQARYYPFNVFSEKKLTEKLDYMHLNPVRRGLVVRAVDWKWSSARWYVLGKSVGIPIRMPIL
jgi:hypothetical protein